MFTVTILDSSKRVLRTYPHIVKIAYNDCGEHIVLEGNDILSHEYSTFATYHLYSDCANYTVKEGIIGTFEVKKEL